jgi:hypothetical protein
MTRIKKQTEVIGESVEEVKDVKVETSTANGEFIYETNGIKYKKIFKDGVIVERVKI